MQNVKAHKYPLTGVFAAIVLTAALPAGAAAEDVEVLHYWTSGGEAKALNLLKEEIEAKGFGWKDMPVAGGGGEAAMTTLRARVNAGNPPTAAQMTGFDLIEWSRQGDYLADLNAIALEEKWDDVIPDAVKVFSKPDGVWIAAPVNIHATNWVWGNKALLDELDIEEPKTWEEFVAAMEKVKAAGKVGLAHGGQPWQDVTLFDSAALASLGAKDYVRAFVDLDPEVLGSDKMLEAFQKMEQLRGFVDDNFSGRDWNLASAMVLNGEAAFQIMGDWAKGEFMSAGKAAGTDFVCFQTPGTTGTVLLDSDQFVMFKMPDEAARNVQTAMASAVVSPGFQAGFSKIKGSVPARIDVSDEGFDECAKKGIRQVREAAESKTLIGSMALGHSNTPAIKSAITDIVTTHFNGEIEAEAAVQALVEAVEAAK
ncbi:ABC transporter substrate-binding protein [Shinella daejeonensis]|uniref:ABC transporter substrate-binding protein n=1 Tax=Shinella daejeonensis TaxID=659017 RepID=UPI0020C75FC1|nr:ABC transporter substrate-binding protein [Shinella daejeonensis]MCP8897450.1 ABC transporter substrate-binding protein [Shinella daejeonensis]